MYRVPHARRPYWMCSCNCGKWKAIRGSSLVDKVTKSCGCISRKHGQSGNKMTRTYRVWRGLIQRCHRPNASGYKYYGARGIKVCQRWRSFQNFFTDMGPCPSGHSIDRIDNNGDYKPSNCRWTTPGQQIRNSRHARMVTFNGITKCLTDWATEKNLRPTTLSGRLDRGWPVAEALQLPPQQSRWHRHLEVAR